MELRFKIKPFSISEIKHNLKQAIEIERVRPNSYGTFGKYKEDYFNKSALVYHAEVKKRGKHKGNITTTIRKYRIPFEVLRLMNCKVIQYPRYFRIVPNK